MKTQNNIWKHGCNWNSAKNSYYDFIKRKQIVFGSDRFRFEVGDLVMITEGFKVKAIAKIEKTPKPITENPEYKSLFEEYKIPFENWVNFARAEWYELPENEVFKYPVQRGAAKVRKPNVKEKAADLWENRKLLELD